MTTAHDHLGTLRGALSDWLYDPRYTAATYEAQAAHADAIEAALAECERKGLGDVGRNLSRGHGWEDTAACWAWRLPVPKEIQRFGRGLTDDQIFYLEREAMRVVLPKHEIYGSFRAISYGDIGSCGFAWPPRNLFDICYFEKITDNFSLELFLEYKTSILQSVLRPGRKRTTSQLLIFAEWFVSLRNKETKSFPTIFTIKSPQGLALLDTVRPKVMP